MTEVALACDALAVHVRAVQAAQVAQREAVRPTLDDAVLLRHNLIE
jgi:hypothetical protein